jgi:flavin reductase (DIM6/NTAB) family NADH-FMN oxidoreductase RutF
MTADAPLPAAFSAAIARLDPAMAIVTTAAVGERAGCLIGFHTQCSIDPPRYAIWLSKANHTYRVALRASHLAVHFVDRSQHELAEHFGALSGDDLDKFASVAWTPGPEGVPILDECPNHLVARRVALLDEGSDHVALVIEPVEVGSDASFEPLRLSQAIDIDPGHGNEERPHPPTERAVGS